MLDLKKQDSLHSLKELEDAVMNRKASYNQNLAYLQRKSIDTMEYRIDRSFSKEQLTKLVLDINKKHTAILSYKDLEYNINDEIVAMHLELIDSRLRSSSFKVSRDSVMQPLKIFEYPDGKSGIQAISSDSAQEPIPQAILDRIAAQEKEAQERAELKEKRLKTASSSESSTKKLKIIVRSSETIPEHLLPEAQRKLRARVKH